MEKKINSSDSREGKNNLNVLATICAGASLILLQACGGATDTKNTEKNTDDMVNKSKKITTTISVKPATDEKTISLEDVWNPMKDTIITPERAQSIKAYLEKNGRVDFVTEKFGNVSFSLIDYNKSIYVGFPKTTYFAIDIASGKQNGYSINDMSEEQNQNNPTLVCERIKYTVGEFEKHIDASK